MNNKSASINNQSKSKFGSSSSLKTSVVLSEDMNLLKQTKTSEFLRVDSPPVIEEEDIHNLKEDSERSILINQQTQDEIILDKPIPDLILQGTVSPVAHKISFSEVEVNSPIGSYQVQEQMLSMSENVDIPSDLL